MTADDLHPCVLIRCIDFACDQLEHALQLIIVQQLLLQEKFEQASVNRRLTCLNQTVQKGMKQFVVGHRNLRINRNNHSNGSDTPGDLKRAVLVLFLNQEQRVD